MSVRRMAAPAAFAPSAHLLLPDARFFRALHLFGGDDDAAFVNRVGGTPASRAGSNVVHGAGFSSTQSNAAASGGVGAIETGIVGTGNVLLLAVVQPMLSGAILASVGPNADALTVALGLYSGGNQFSMRGSFTSSASAAVIDRPAVTAGHYTFVLGLQVERGLPYVRYGINGALSPLAGGASILAGGVPKRSATATFQLNPDAAGNAGMNAHADAIACDVPQDVLFDDSLHLALYERFRARAAAKGQIVIA